MAAGVPGEVMGAWEAKQVNTTIDYMQQCIDGSNHRQHTSLSSFPRKSSNTIKNLLIMLCMKLLFMCMKQKCNFYFQQYVVLVTFVDFYASFL